MIGGQGPSDVWGQLDQQNATTFLEIWPECKREVLDMLHGDAHMSTYPTASQFIRALRGSTSKGEPPSSLNLFLDDATVGGTD